MVKCRDAELLAAYELGPGYHLELAIADSTEALRAGSTVRLCVTEELLETDIRSSSLGDMVASLLLLKPLELGDRVRYFSFAVEYYERLVCDEVKKLKRLLRENIERAVVADIYPLVARLSRLAKVFLWLKPHIAVFGKEGSYYEWLRAIARAAGVESRAFKPAQLDCSREKRKRTRSLPPLHSLAFSSLFNIIEPSLIMEALSAKTPPLFEDPLLLVRLDAAKIATKIIDFEDQLLNITSVKRILKLVGEVKRSRRSPIRSVESIEVSGFKAAIVKKYRDLTAVKWIVAAIASIPLPKPRLNPLSRLNAEYYYNRLLDEYGFNVPKPLLVDPRRRMAAYEFIEGTDLSQELQKSFAPPTYYELGELLAKVHSYNVALWDTNPSNFLDTAKGIYIVDLEQARRTEKVEDKAWDIALAAYFSAIYMPKAADTRARMIAEGYLKAGGSGEVVEEAGKPKYAIPFIAALPPTLIDKVRRSIIAPLRAV